MTICHAILTPVVVLLRTFVRIVREVVRTVCGWVSTVIRTVRTVVERICRWLPWPLSALCNLVTRVIVVFETLWSWVCRNVLERIVSWLEQIVEYVAYVLRWVCWVLSWPVRVVNLLLCRLGLRPTLYLHVCIRVLTDSEGVPAVGWDKVAADIRQATVILARCNIRLVLISRETLQKPEYLEGTTCDASGMFASFFTWFAQNECEGCSSTTVYYVKSIPEASGCSYPGSNWVTVASDGDGSTMVQEIGHLCDLWAHSSDPNNVMTDQPGGTKDQITSAQCCMMRTSRFTSSLPCAPPETPSAPDRTVLTVSDNGAARHSNAFQVLRSRTPGSEPPMPSRMVQAAVAVVVATNAVRRVYRLLQATASRPVASHHRGLLGGERTGTARVLARRR